MFLNPRCPKGLAVAVDGNDLFVEGQVEQPPPSLTPRLFHGVSRPQALPYGDNL